LKINKIGFLYLSGQIYNFINPVKYMILNHTIPQIAASSKHAVPNDAESKRRALEVLGLTPDLLDKMAQLTRMFSQ
jgi:hypothetical protein